MAVLVIAAVAALSVYLAMGATHALFHVVSHAFNDEDWRKRDALAWLLIWPLLVMRGVRQ